MRRVTLWAGMLMLFFLPGCSQIRELKENPWAEAVLDYAPGFFWAICKWTLMCGLAGALIAVPIFFLLRYAGAYRWKWKYAKYFRGCVCVLVVLLTSIFGATIGLNEGIYSGLREVVESQKLMEELKPVGEAGADLVGGLFILVSEIPAEELFASMEESGTEGPPVSDEPTPAVDEAESTPEDDANAILNEQVMDTVQAELERFREGEWELHIAEFKQQLATAQKECFEYGLPALKELIREEYPSLKEGTGAKLLDWLVDTFGEMLITRLVERELDRAGLRDPITLVWEGLDDLAKETGDPNTVSHAELADYLVNRLLHAMVLYPAKVTVRGNQLTLMVTWLLIMMVPIAFFQIAEEMRARGVHERLSAWIKSKMGSRQAGQEDTEEQ